MAAQWTPIHSQTAQSLQEPREHLEACPANTVPIPISESCESGQHKGCHNAKVDCTEVLKVLNLVEPVTTSYILIGIPVTAALALGAI